MLHVFVAIWKPEGVTVQLCCKCAVVYLLLHCIIMECILYSIAATQKAAQSKITVEDQIKAIQEAHGLL